MEAYTSFAQVYDLFMDNVPYEEWSEYVISLLKEEKIEDGLVLDLGCGTGKMTRLLAAAGYDMIGIDNSEDMLEIARECQYDDLQSEMEEVQSEIAEVSQKEEAAGNILYLLQDMREFELYGTVQAVISICDSMNYILEEEDLLQVFKLVNNYLDPKGIFVFDMNTRYKYATLLGDTTITENREEGSFIWENYFDEEEDINQY
ncbi:MAG: class I SAM-dependent methyltransferase, partial [Roseburia sp.]|nr:class I SAM-dependent methyltransferase [Roseburia sp.]